ncbi:hypothetical protein [Desulfovibrio inopinatus]|nr:hypothetical protein [Desulfovibrio inopinatus]
MSRFRNRLQHVLNPLHMYCRLQGIGLKRTVAHRMCLVYERYVYRFIL